MSMHNHGDDHDHLHDDLLDDEPPPSYEEATGSSSNNHNHSQQQEGQRPVPAAPPPLPPRTPSRKPLAASAQPSSPSPSTSTTTSPRPNNYGSSFSSPTSSSPTTRPPPQDFSQLLPQAQLIRRQFPPAINLYREAFPGALQARCFLAEHQPSPLYAVSSWAAAMGRGPGGLPLLAGMTGALAPPPSTLVLHNGPSEDHPPLATVSYEMFGRRAEVSLPPLEPGKPSSSQMGNPALPVQMPSRMSKVLGFRVEVPWHGAPSADQGGSSSSPTSAWRTEAYEWRPSNGGAVNMLGGASHGWKLVRLERELPTRRGAAVPGAGSGPPSGDGFEVVAVCATAVMSMTKLWKFSFLGTGVTGALGERWAVMAVVTGLVLWDRESRR